jgi:hypothetical protein
VAWLGGTQYDDARIEALELPHPFESTRLALEVA